MKRYFMTALFLGLTPVLLLSGFACIIGASSYYQCSRYAELSGKDARYIFMDDCYIYTGKSWLDKHKHQSILFSIEMDNIRVMNSNTGDS